MTANTHLEPLSSSALAQFMLLAGRRTRIHTFMDNAGADVPADAIQRYARDRGAWMVERGTFADSLNHHIAVEDDSGELVAVEISRAELGLEDFEDLRDPTEDTDAYDDAEE